MIHPEDIDWDDVDREATKWAIEAPNTVLTCRMFGHMWTGTDELSAPAGAGYGRYKVRNLTCRRCRTERYDVLMDGEYHPVYRRYNYPENYTRPKGDSGSASVPRPIVDEALRAKAKTKPANEATMEFLRAIRASGGLA
jgi:hypothetical protein